MIIKFSAYAPFDISTLSFGERIAVWHKICEFSQNKLAHNLAIDPLTLRKRESNKRQLSERVLKDLDTSSTYYPSG